MPKQIAEKSCGPQLTATALPTQGWLLSDLTSFAQQQNETIIQDEKTLATHYWKLGLVLTLARQHITRGQWGKQLAELGIDKTRSSKAMAIYRTFANLDALADKTVEEAYQTRTRKPKSNRDTEPHEESLDSKDGDRAGQSQSSALRGILCDLNAHTESWIHEAAFVESDEASELLELLSTALQTLRTAEQHLKKKCLRT